MPKIPHKHAHWPDKAKEWSVCACGDRVPYPTALVLPPPTERAPGEKPITWEGVRKAVKPFAADRQVDLTDAVVRYLLSCGVEVQPPF